MSNTAQKAINASLVAGSPGVDLLEGWGLGDMPVTPEERVLGWDGATFRPQVRANGVTQTLAYLSDLAAFGRFRGALDSFEHSRLGAWDMTR